MNQPMLRSDYAFHLPGELIAQHPLDRRDDSRLLCLDRRDGALSHRRFRDRHTLRGHRLRRQPSRTGL